jgi:ribonucleoside-triphosphate reductase
MLFSHDLSLLSNLAKYIDLNQPHMSSAEITIIKRDGSRKAFSVEKIKNAIRKAFLSVGAFATEEDLVNILSHLRITEGMSVEEIQNQVEVGLMAEQ